MSILSARHGETASTFLKRAELFLAHATGPDAL
jgi:hypothetical protein